MTTYLTPSPKMQFFDANGNPLAGGKLYTYASGTSTPLTSYTDYTGNTANTNPIILDSRGEADLWLGTATYRLVLETAANVLIWTVDGVSGSFSAADISYLAAGAGAVLTTVQAKLRQTVSVQDFGAVGDGTTDDTLAIQAAIDALSQAGVGGTVLLPAGTYKITENLDITWPNSTDQNTPGRITIQGEGADLSYIYDYRSNASAATGGAITIDFTTGYANKFFTMYFGEFSLIKKLNATTYDSATTTYTIGVGTGLYMKNVPNIGEFRNIRIIGYDVGVNLIDCLGVIISNFNVQLADLGFVVAQSVFSEPTAMQFNSCTVAGIKSIAYLIQGGGPIAFNGGVIESCGVMSGSSQGVSGAIYYQATAFLPTQLVIDGVFFENNAGAADIYINAPVSIASRASSSINNCMFARNSATIYTTNNIYVLNNSATASLIVTTISNGFKGYSPYAASGSRLYITKDGTNTAGTIIYNLGNFYDDAVETPTVVIDITGSSGSQNLQSVTTIGSTTTNNSEFNGVNIGTFSTIPSLTTTGTTIGFGNSTNAALLVVAAWRGAANNTNDLGASGVNWNNVYGTTYNVGSGTASITASGNNVVLNGVAAAVSGGTPGFAPANNDTQFLGGSALKWKSLYLAGILDWNSYAIPAPAGSTTTFLRNDGTWVVPAGSGTGTVTSVSVVSANGLTGTVATPTTTPAITLTTSITGVLKGNGTAISAAVAGTDYVTPTGAETLSNKTLTAPVLGTPASGALTNCTFPTLNQNTTGTSGGLTGSPSITVTGVTVGSATTALGSSGTNTTLGNNTVFVAPATGFAPSVDNAYVLGGPSNRWTTVYATTGTINTSDGRQKQQGRSLSDAERAVAVKVKGLIKTFKYNAAVEKKGDAARIHVGVYAQELSDAFASEGLDAADYGMFCYDELESTNVYGVRYEELLAFVISAL